MSDAEFALEDVVSTHGSVNTAIETRLSFLHVAMILHAISPRFAIRTRLIFVSPEIDAWLSNVCRGSLSVEETTEEVIEAVPAMLFTTGVFILAWLAKIKGRA